MPETLKLEHPRGAGSGLLFLREEELRLAQDLLYFGYRDFTATRPADASIAIFAGSHKPDNSPHQWVKDAWR